MASRRNATPLFDLVGPLAPGTDSKPRYRSPVPPPAPAAPPHQANPPTRQDTGQEPGPSSNAGDNPPQASTAVAEPGRKPIEIHTAQTLPGPTTDSGHGDTADATVPRRAGRPTSADESSPIGVIENKHAPHGAPAPAPTPAPTVRVQPEPDRIDSFDQTQAFGTPRGFADLKQTLLTGTNRIYFASGVAIIGLVLVWLVLNALLSSGTTPDIDTSAGIQTHAEGGIVDPLGDGSVSSAGAIGGRQVPTIEMGGSTGASAAVAGTNAQLTPALGLTVDPRVPGQNYLHLARLLSRSEATRAAAFLTERGHPAIAVRMDSGTLQGNNTEKFWLISLFDVPEGRYSAMEGQRDVHEERIAALGVIWARDHGGTVNFHDPYWVKYDR